MCSQKKRKLVGYQKDEGEKNPVKKEVEYVCGNINGVASFFFSWMERAEGVAVSKIFKICLYRTFLWSDCVFHTETRNVNNLYLRSGLGDHDSLQGESKVRQQRDSNF